MRLLWCVCIRFQPNPALQRASGPSQSISGSRKMTRTPSVSKTQILKAMRKSFVYAAGLICLALSITNCHKEPVDQATPASEPNFELFALPVTTKTANDGLNTKWVADDDINVFHAVAGSTTYVSDGEFTVKDTETGSFDGTVKTLDADKSYDWYAFYPYTSQIETPDNTNSGYCYIGSRSDRSQAQVGNDNMLHIAGSNYPLYGIAKGVKASDVPSIQMQHLTSVIKVVVTNSTEESLSLSSVSFTAGEDISGQFYISFDSETPTYTPAKYPSETAELTVSDVTVAAKAEATVYMAIKPFTAKSGSTLKLAVNGYEKTITLDKDITFTACHIKPLNFNFDKKILDCVTLPWSIDGTGGSDVWKNTVGLSQKGLGSDYGGANSPYLTKLDASNDYVQVKYDSPASYVKFAVKMIGGETTSYMTVQGSAGQSFTDIEKFTISGTQNDILSFTTSQPIDSEYRYIRLLFTKGSNVGLGAVEISKYSTDPAISADNILNVSARGVENQMLAYTITNPVEGAVLSVAGDDTVVEAIEVDGTITYDVKKNTSTEPRDGSITLTYSKDGATLTEKTVKVQQNAPVFKTSKTTVELAATADASTTITLTSDFDWRAKASTDAAFTFSPDSYIWTGDGKQTVTIKATAANESENGTIDLGTVTFTNSETNETIEVKVTQKSSYVAPTTGATVTKKISEISGISSKTQDGTQVTKMKMNDVITLAVSSGTNTGKVYEGGAEWRLYQNESAVLTVSAKEGYALESITVIYSNKNTGVLLYNSAKVTSASAIAVSGNEVKFSVGNTSAKVKNGQVRITEVSATYKEK